MDLTTLTTNQFVQATASGEPVPGGGSISALCGALAAALGEMVARLTSGKKKYADVQPQIDSIIAKLQPLSPRLVNDVDCDSEAYDLVFKAYKLSKDTEEQKALRTQEIQAALKHAASVPLGVATTVASVIPDLLELAVIGNQNAITDVYVATLCARTAILGACANTRINLGSINDAAYVEETTQTVSKLEQEANDAECSINKIVFKALGINQ